jgi:hypothetical protein
MAIIILVITLMKLRQKPGALLQATLWVALAVGTYNALFKLIDYSSQYPQSIQMLGGGTASIQISYIVINIGILAEVLRNRMSTPSTSISQTD